MSKTNDLRSILLNELGLENKRYTLDELDLALNERRKQPDFPDLDFSDLNRELSEWSKEIEDLGGLDSLLDDMSIDSFFEEDKY